MYTSLIKPGTASSSFAQVYPPTIRVNINLAGSGTVRCWEQTQDGTKRREMPALDDWRNAKLEAVMDIERNIAPPGKETFP